MAYSFSERLSATDTLFLDIEKASVHMHVGAVALFDAKALRAAAGHLDIELVRGFSERALLEAPRCREKLAWIPRFDHPVWIDDEGFNLDYHVRHAALPPPGDLRQLKRLVGRLMSQKLDRARPLWEMWIVEGLEDDRFAIVLKVHHCMVDGLAGLDLLATLLREEPDRTLPPRRVWRPRPAPSARRLLADEVAHRASLPLELARSVPGMLLHPGRVISSVRESVSGLGEVARLGLAPSATTPFQTDLGPYRRFDWTRLSMARIGEVRAALGGTLNDVVLAVVAGAVRRFVGRRGQRLGPEDVFRALVPVSVRRPDDRGKPGNRVVNFLARLPVDEREPGRRLQRVVETTRAAKRSGFVEVAEWLEDLSDRSFDSIVGLPVKLATRTHAYGMVVTNVPGPSGPLHLLGARMLELYPLVPLFSGQGAGVALFSYAGHLYWGINADWDAFPDLHGFVEDIEYEFERLCEAALLALERSRSARAPRERR